VDDHGMMHSRAPSNSIDKFFSSYLSAASIGATSVQLLRTWVSGLVSGTVELMTKRSA
jgi:hypothetical protein